MVHPRLALRPGVLGIVNVAVDQFLAVEIGTEVKRHAGAMPIVWILHAAGIEEFDGRDPGEAVERAVFSGELSLLDLADGRGSSASGRGSRQRHGCQKREHRGLGGWNHFHWE